ncbi:hypothetical protein HS088_TW01G00827 [Tripterygium wilfordii]|uniref:Uncharacterized protein n=1 Tax=Tripterygium wilfordii TaxID=458696 RepID=A0A7J7E2Z7_TRIWF|nr:hypothetical protein HS088_TW01G00827 [Tripterygium wilfordii]
MESPSRNRELATTLSPPISRSPAPVAQAPVFNPATATCQPGNSMRIEREQEEWDFDGVGPTGPEDFGSLGGSVEPGYEDYYNEVRARYVTGLQKMI